MVFDSRLPVNPAMMTLARQLRGFSLVQVREQSDIPLPTLLAYELEGGVLPRRDLFTLAHGYGFPIPFFQRAGEIHEKAFICFRRAPIDELLVPLQQILNEIVGEDVIADVAFEDDGIYINAYHSDEDWNPSIQRKIGNTLLQAERWLKRMKRMNPDGLLVIEGFSNGD